jgi:rhamnogalacturonyl hydrolase YesR
MTPTARSLKHLRAEGWLAEVVEKWNSFTRTRKDLWGWCDILAIRAGEVLAVQVTSGSNVAARVHKIAESETVTHVRDAGIGIVVHGWRKNAQGRWTLREVDVS